MNYENEVGVVYARRESRDQFRSGHRTFSVKKRCSEKFCKFHSKKRPATVLKRDFNAGAFLLNS